MPDKGAVMIEVSELAATALLESLRVSGVGPDRGLRLIEKEGTFILDIDSPAEDDRVLRLNEDTVIIVSRDIEERCGAALIDVEEGPNGNKLTLRSVDR